MCISLLGLIFVTHLSLLLWGDASTFFFPRPRYGAMHTSSKWQNITDSDSDYCIRTFRFILTWQYISAHSDLTIPAFKLYTFRLLYTSRLDNTPKQNIWIHITLVWVLITQNTKLNLLFKDPFLFRPRWSPQRQHQLLQAGTEKKYLVRGILQW